MDWGIDFKFVLMNPSLLFASFTILLMYGFQERLFAMSRPRYVAADTALSVSSCIVYGLCMGDFDRVMCIISHLEGLKVICHDCSQSIGMLRSCCRLSWSVEDWVVDERFKGGSWGNMGGYVIYIEKGAEDSSLWDSRWSLPITHISVARHCLWIEMRVSCYWPKLPFSDTRCVR